MTWLAPVLLCAPAAAHAGEEPLPEPQAEFVREFCLECHSTEEHRGGLDLEALRVDWEGDATHETLALMHELLATGDMPTEKGASQPSDEQRAAMVDWLRRELDAHSEVGGTVLRRLNRVEYQNTISDLFGIELVLPGSFPLDTPAEGFDTIGEALVISPPQLRQYVEVASLVADELIKLQRPQPVDRRFPGNEFEGQMSGLLADRARLVSAIDELTWSSRPGGFEAPYDGRYRLTVSAAAFGPPLAGDSPRPLLEVRARAPGAALVEPFSTCRWLAAFEPEPGDPREFVIEADLLEGEALALQFANSPLRKRGTLHVHPETIEYARREHSEFLEALIAVGYDLSESTQRNYDRIVQAMGTPDGAVSEEQRRDYLRRLEGLGMVRALLFPLWHRAHDIGPAIDVFELRAEGPVGPLQELSRWLPAQGARDDRAFADDALRPLLRRALRRPPTEEDVARYVGLAVAHGEREGGIRPGLHFAVRALLCSPEFLYRGTRAGPLDDHDLAARLSYFLWSTTPPDQLLDLADAGALSDPARLELVARRMLQNPRARQLAKNFTGQWLWTRKIHGIMPDERLFPHWSDAMYRVLADETELFFLAVLSENLDVANFLDSDFTFLNERLAEIYGIPGVRGNKLRRVALDGAHHRGGVLGQAAVMMATANGVDTSPVIRGVWLLENIAGDGVGDPPAGVPALTPDSTGATTMRERIALHRADPLCARCHDRIDPMGFALEGYDAIGGWRDHYPRVVATADGGAAVEDGPPIQTSGELPDGTLIRDVEDLRAYLLAHKPRFYRCLAEKLLVYGAGRRLNSADQAVVDGIAEDALSRGYGFADLVVAVVLSESFRTK